MVLSQNSGICFTHLSIHACCPQYGARQLDDIKKRLRVFIEVSKNEIDIRDAGPALVKTVNLSLLRVLLF